MLHPNTTSVPLLTAAVPRPQILRLQATQPRLHRPQLDLVDVQVVCGALRSPPLIGLSPSERTSDVVQTIPSWLWTMARNTPIPNHGLLLLSDISHHTFPNHFTQPPARRAISSDIHVSTMFHALMPSEDTHTPSQRDCQCPVSCALLLGLHWAW